MLKKLFSFSADNAHNLSSNELKDMAEMYDRIANISLAVMGIGSTAVMISVAQTMNSGNIGILAIIGLTTATATLFPTLGLVAQAIKVDNELARRATNTPLFAAPTA